MAIVRRAPQVQAVRAGFGLVTAGMQVGAEFTRKERTMELNTGPAPRIIARNDVV